jgi:hypothetical protein
MAGPRSDEIKQDIRTEDIGPTILDLFGVSAPDWYEGRTAIYEKRSVPA